MTEYDMAAIFEELHQFVRNGDRRPGEFTNKEYAAQFGKTRSWASVELKGLEQMGMVKRRRGSVDGHSCILYRKAETTES